MVTLDKIRKQLEPLRASLAAAEFDPNTAQALSKVGARDLFIRDSIAEWNDTRDDSRLLDMAQRLEQARTACAHTVAAGFAYVAGDTQRARALVDSVVKAAPSYSLAALLNRALSNAVPSFVWIQAVLDTRPEEIGFVANSPVTDSLVAIPQAEQVQAITLTSPAQLVSALRYLAQPNGLVRSYYAVVLTFSHDVVCTIGADSVNDLRAGIVRLMDTESSASHVVLVSLVGDTADLTQHSEFPLSVADVLAVDSERMVWRSALCADDSCCPADGASFVWNDPA